jgi:hypothetical protein
LPGLDDGLRAASLHADLDDLFGLADGLDHAAALFERMGHGLFEVDVFAGVEGGEQTGSVLVIGRGYDDGVDAALRQQVVIVQIGFGLRGIVRGQCHIGLVDFGHGHAFGAQLLEIAVEIAAAPSGADQPVGDAIVGAPGAARNEQRRGQRGAQESSAVPLHGNRSPSRPLYNDSRRGCKLRRPPRYIVLG